MIRGIYTASAGLATVQLRLGVVSNNVANMTTPGYKQDRLPEEFGKALDLAKFAVDSSGNPVGTLALGPKVGVSQLDLAAGPVQETANPLDLALAGGGFFAVQRPDGSTAYTRDGGFHTDASGTLLARDGSQVLSTTNQPIVIPSGADVAVAADGTVLATGTSVGQLQIADFAAGSQLTKVGNGLFVPQAGAAPTTAAGAQVYQGYLEGSNVDLNESMVATMNLVRAYEANQKLLQMQDQTLRSAVNDVGKA